MCNSTVPQKESESQEYFQLNLFDAGTTVWKRCSHCGAFEHYLHLSNGFCRECAEGETGHTCRFCDEPLKRGENYRILKIYDSPWQDSPDEVYLHASDDREYAMRILKSETHEHDCSSNLFDSSYTDFHYQICDICQRNIIVRCPSNGWHEYFRYADGAAVCLKCYEEQLFRDGVPRDSFEDGTIPGMFLDDKDLVAAGFVQIMESYIKDSNDAKKYCKDAISLIDAGHIVVTNYEHLGIGGSEGHVSLWAKKRGVAE